MKRPPCHPRQRGATLMITLMLLSVILLLGAATTSLLLLEERGGDIEGPEVPVFLCR